MGNTCAAGEPCDLRARSKSADIALQRQEEPASEVNLSTETDDGIHPTLVAGLRCWETVFKFLGKGLGKPLLGLSDASSGLGNFVRLRYVKAGSILRQAFVEHRVKKRAVLAAHTLGYTPDVLGANYLSERATGGKLSTQSGLQIRLEVPGKSVARVVFEDGFLISQFRPQFLHFRVYRILDASPDGDKDAPRGVITHLLNARLVNARVNIDAEIIIARARVNIDEAASIVDDSVGEGKLHHSLLKFDIRVVVKRPGRIAAR